MGGIGEGLAGSTAERTVERLRCGAIRGETGASEPRLFTCVIAPGILWPTHEAETPIRQGGRFRKIRGDGPTWMGGLDRLRTVYRTGRKRGPSVSMS